MSKWIINVMSGVAGDDAIKNLGKLLVGRKHVPEMLHGITAKEIGW